MNEILNETATNSAVFKVHKPINKLRLVNTLLETLNKSEILYCHWKSNEHLGASMTADTDLDVLFDEKQKAVIEQMLLHIGFKKFNSIKQKQYRDIEDFIGLDFESGKIIHLHAHFRLTMGEAYIKSYQLNIEDKILSSRIFDDNYGIYCTHPAFELILIYLREALKIRNRDILKMYIKNRVNYTGNILSEYKWLKQKTSDAEIANASSLIFKDEGNITPLVQGPFNRKQLLKLSLIIKKEFKTQRQYAPLQVLLLRWYRELSIKLLRKSTKIFDHPIVAQRINPRSGLIISVIGADGSGKSTVIGDLQSTFKKKLDVYRIYLGKGDGKMSWQRKALRSLKGKPKPKVEELKSTSDNIIKGEKKISFKNKLFQCLEALIVAGEKKKNLKRMQLAKKKGMLVICDRFPQNQIMGYNDGPMLSHLANASNIIFRTFSKIEKKTYEYAENNAPDVVFKLIADAKTVAARKPGETKFEVLEAKIDGIKKVKFANYCKVVTIDATQPLDKVLYSVKKEIWKTYQ